MAIIGSGLLLLLAWLVVALPSLALGDSTPATRPMVFWIEALPLSIISALLLTGGILAVLPPQGPAAHAPMRRLAGGLSVALGGWLAYGIFGR